MLIASVLVGLIILYLVANSVYSYGFSRKKDYVDLHEIEFEKHKKQLPVPFSKVIKANDGVELYGDIYMNRNNFSSKIAIIIHGYGFSRKSVIGIADAYYNDFGYSVLLPDLRAHGESGGKYVGFGWSDSKDILNWILYVKEMFGENVQIVLHGISMGGATALLTGAKRSEDISAIISDCSFSSIKDILILRLRKDLNLPKFPFIYIVDFIMRIRCKYSIKDGNVKEEVKKIRCPVFYIHGQDDDFIPVGAVYALYENTKSYKKLYICPAAGHAQSALIDPEEYRNRISNFLKYVFGRI
ncbi:MAG: alpha/beta hydrolase [Clostridia bacterium]|nr:alpha/beta hydrolase [Clostridia bacterium]